MRDRSPTALVLMGLAAGCGGDDVEVVPADVARVTATARCTPLAAGARVLGTSSEGELWLAGADGATTVLDAGGGARTDVARVDDASAVVPWSPQAAALVAGGELWTVDGAGREFVPLPEELGTVAHLCGDPLAGWSGSTSPPVSRPTPAW